MAAPIADEQAASESASALYALVSSSQLPSFDAGLMIKHVALSEARLNTYNRTAYRYNRLMEISYIAGYVLRVIGLFAPKAIGEWVVVISLLAQCPAALTVVLTFRYEFVKILAQTYDFWYFLVVNLIWLWSSIVFMGDIRIALLPLLAIELQNGALLDAYLDNMQRIVMIAWITAAFFMTLLAAVATGIFEYKRAELVLLAANFHSLTLTELYVNATSTILILVIRIAYRRRIALRCPRTSASSIQCITYRTALKLQLVTSSTGAAGPAVLQRTKNPGQERRLQIRLVRMDGPFDADLLVFRIFKSWRPLPFYQRLVLYGIFVIGIIVTLFPMSRTVAYSKFGALCATLACVFTLSYCGLFLASSQRFLLLKIITSFDFFFLSMQISMSTICLCDMFSWIWPACCGAFCSWLWIHWVLLLDAITPIMKHKLGFSIRLATLVVLLYMSMQLTVCLDILVWNHWKLQNRLIMEQDIFHHRTRFFVMPFFFSRSLTIVIWCCRLLWRIWMRAHPDELIMLKGNVEYPTPPHMRCAPKKKTTVAVNPNADRSFVAPS